jgi:hypothetical protein
VLTYLLTLAGAPSVPGAHSYPEVYPLALVARLPPAAIRLRTPLAYGNIAVFADRWNLIETDTLPDYLAFIRDHAQAARALLATPISRRVARYRLLARTPQLALAAITHWNLNLSTDRTASRTGGPHPPSRGLVSKSGTFMIDLRRPATRESMQFAPNRDGQVWMNNDRSPFDLTVALPSRRRYRASAEMVIAMSSTLGGAPDRLAVQLGPADLAQTTQLLLDYGRTWGFPRNAVAQWRKEAERRASSDRTYSTHVFTPYEVAFVRVEFQVSHHVRDGDFVTVALFSWQAPPQ